MPAHPAKPLYRFQNLHPNRRAKNSRSDEQIAPATADRVRAAPAPAQPEPDRDSLTAAPPDPRESHESPKKAEKRRLQMSPPGPTAAGSREAKTAFHVPMLSQSKILPNHFCQRIEQLRRPDRLMSEFARQQISCKSVPNKRPLDRQMKLVRHSSQQTSGHTGQNISTPAARQHRTALKSIINPFSVANPREGRSF